MMLPRVLELGDVRDVEAFCRAILHARIPAGELQGQDWDEALAFLISETYVQSTRYDPAKCERLSLFLRGVLPQRLIDHLRAPYGTVGQRPLPGRGRLEHSGALVGGDSLEGALGGRESDRGLPGADALGWMVEGRDSEVLRSIERLGLRPPERPPERAPRGDREPGRGAGGVNGGPWVDCSACGWRSYPSAPNGKPGWTPPAECGGCGAPLETAAVA